MTRIDQTALAGLLLSFAFLAGCIGYAAADEAEEAPAEPAPTMQLRITDTIPMPRVLELDRSIRCEFIASDVLRCTARVPVEE